MLSRLSLFSRRHASNPRRPHHRLNSTTHPAPQTRIARLESRLPAFLRRYTTPLRTAPVSHITAFLLLHELTAIVPLVSLTAAFHYFDWLPPWLAEGALVKQGVERFGRYARRKGWIEEDEGGTEGWGKWYGRGEGGVRFVVELATAWAVTKVLLPLRLVLSVWGTPWFARLAVLPVARWVRMGFGGVGAAVGGGSKRVVSPAAGTNAVGGGVVQRGK